MKQKMLKQWNRFSLVLLCALLLSMIFLPSGITYAAEKAELSEKTLTIGIGSVFPEGNFYPGCKYNLTVYNPVKNATYSYKSSNTSIVKVKEDGTAVYLTGIKPGKATVTCTQTLKGKTTTIGKCKITVVKASIRTMGDTLCLGNNILWASYDSVCQIDFRNNNEDVHYTYKSDSKNLTMSECRVDMSDTYCEGSYIYCQEYTAKKAGTYKITVYENEGKSSTKIGTFKVTVSKPEYCKKMTLCKGEQIDFSQIVSYPLNNSIEDYYIKGNGFDLKKSKSILTMEKYDNGYTVFTADKAGTAKVTLYHKTDKGSEKITDITIKIKDAQ